MRKVILAANWKMNKSFQDAEDFLLELKDFMDDQVRQGRIESIICTPFVYLELATDIASDSCFRVGAQNVSNHKQGAYTGEIAASMLNSMEVDYCIVGHSERRKIFHENDKLVNDKIKILQENDIIPIICIGETLEQRENGTAEEIVEEQLKGALQNIRINNDIVIAYEPVWAIGTGKTATPEQAQTMHAFIRSWLKSSYGDATASIIPILYGGSVSPDNIKSLLAQKDIDGGLIGGASLDVEKYKSMFSQALLVKS
ncbi:MAG: triose-phosphate isomerase [Candidatus Cloacimonetes bacterium]|nr:triose-phosphate isomerase [Candidatus Cloacimonadota bacterium]